MAPEKSIGIGRYYQIELEELGQKIVKVLERHEDGEWLVEDKSPTGERIKTTFAISSDEFIAPVLPHISKEAKEAIAKGIQRGDSVADLELLGFSQRLANLLEVSRYRITTVEQLMKRKQHEFSDLFLFGPLAMVQLFESLARYGDLEELQKGQEEKITVLREEHKDYSPSYDPALIRSRKNKGKN